MERHEDTIAILKRKGIKPTSNRILVMDVLLHSRHPMSLNDIELKLIPMDKSSIFRVLTLFRETDAVHTIEDGTGSLKYEVCHGNGEHLQHLHVHFHCEVCKQTYCLENISIPIVDLPSGFDIHSANYTLKGVCPKCCKQ